MSSTSRTAARSSTASLVMHAGAIGTTSISSPTPITTARSTSTDSRPTQAPSTASGRTRRTPTASQVHTHNITTHTCEIDGDAAYAESYVIVVLLGRDGRTAQFISGRYLDRLERRDGEWRIALRRSTVEVMFIADASVLQSSFFKEQGYIKGSRDRSDLSYQRPLGPEVDPPERW